MSRELAAHDRVQPACSAMAPNDMAARDGALGTARLVRQRTDAGVRVKHAAGEPRRAGKHALRLAGKVRALAAIDLGRTRIAFETLVGRTDQEQLVPRQDEKRPVIGARLDVDADTWRPGKRGHDDV